MNEQYAEMITAFPLFRGFTLDGAHMLLDCGEVRELSARSDAYRGGGCAHIRLARSHRQIGGFCRTPRTGSGAEPKPGPVRFWVNWLSYAAYRDPPQCGRPRTQPSCNGVRRAFRSLLLRNVFLSERIFRESLRTLIEKERSLIESLVGDLERYHELKQRRFMAITSSACH